jgi:hypothetical protein
VLTTTARPLTAGTLTPAAQGKGTLDLTKALAVTSVAAAYSYPNSTGSGALELARGSAHLIDNGVVLNGARDIFGDAISTATLASRRAAGDGLDWRHLERPHVIGQQLHRHQLDRYHLDGAHVVGADVVQRAHVVRAHVVGRDLDRADVVRRWPVRQHLVQRRLERTRPEATPGGAERQHLPPRAVVAQPVAMPRK